MPKSVDQATRELLKVLRQMVPGIPETTTRLELTLSQDGPPRIACDWFVKDVDAINEEDFEMYSVFEVHPKGEQSASKCTCHERDGSYVCEHCFAQGHRGHMQKGV
jgi:hypothetical protein